MPLTYQLGNPVERLAEVLTKNHAVDISKQTIRKAAEQVRILETRVKTGNLGKYDRPNTRAAVLLELAYRQETKSRLPWQKLEKAVNTKTLHLEQLQQSLNNYLQPPSSIHPPIQRSTQVPIIRQLTGQKRPIEVRRSSRSTTAQADPRRIEALAIRLQILDSSKASQLAQQLFDQMTQFVVNHPTMNESDRRGQLYDFVRYGPAYEAAALICVADVALEDLIDASTEFTRLELKQVLPFVKETYHTLKQQQPNTKRQRPEKAEDVMEVDNSIPEIEPAMPEEDTYRQQEQEEENRFVEWRQLQLESAMDQARSQRRNDPNIPYTNSQLLAFAADDILRKYGVLT
ncbi:hypothetical protein FisN_3Hh512 [Fistulifera solaris]|jgi:hypothetical protein|uniref:Uncharacterized protein n=1 Tax=Fistulifera solaris TaxID=1519565 RepID=A0A1Z5K671_FISSO|nr:hypothetical protein FisN_3Hh512 [Fistulifera solaris]|eukprot:GAX21719.1 hypothetical protein FisN_3Hh512 [Fistulifera solaris]